VLNNNIHQLTLFGLRNALKDISTKADQNNLHFIILNKWQAKWLLIINYNFEDTFIFTNTHIYIYTYGTECTKISTKIFEGKPFGKTYL